MSAYQKYRNLDTLLPALRKEYSKGKLLESTASTSPFQQFARWFDVAIKNKVPALNVMILSTATRFGKTSSRAVLLKGFDESGLVFFTDYRSRKAKEISQNPYGTCVFFWPELERQVAVSGRLKKISKSESAAYFKTRPRWAQLAAWVSNQSHAIQSRKMLEARFKEICERYDNKPVPLPTFWGGYRLAPHSFEFWQGRPNRLNDRLIYQKKGKRWKRSRLQP